MGDKPFYKSIAFWFTAVPSVVTIIGIIVHALQSKTPVNWEVIGTEITAILGAAGIVVGIRRAVGANTAAVREQTKVLAPGRDFPPLQKP